MLIYLTDMLRIDLRFENNKIYINLGLPERGIKASFVTGKIRRTFLLDCPLSYKECIKKVIRNKISPNLWQV